MSEIWTFVQHSYEAHKVPEVKKKFRISDISQKCLKLEQKVWIPDMIWPKMCLKTDLFENWTVIEYLKSVLVQISDTYCIQ